MSLLHQEPMDIFYTWSRITDIAEAYIEKALQEALLRPQSIGFITGLRDGQHALSAHQHDTIDSAERLETVAAGLRAMQPPNIARLEAVGLLARVPGAVIATYLPVETEETVFLFHVEHVFNGYKTWVKVGEEQTIFEGWTCKFPSIIPLGIQGSRGTA